MIRKILVIWAFTILSVSYAIDESDYLKQYQKKVWPLIEKMKAGTFIGENNIEIHYRTYIQNNAKNCVVILPGRTEPVEKYGEVVFDLIQSETGKNLNFYLMDHRGQGSSGRMTSPHDLGHVDRFNNYILDVESFVKNQKLDSLCEKKFLLAHSLGAGIAVAYIIKNPNTFQKVVLTSPMLKILTRPYPYVIAETIVKSAVLAGLGAKFGIKQKPFDPYLKFEGNKFTTSLERFKMTMELNNTYPLTKLGGVSNQWLLEVMKGTNKFRSSYRQIGMPLRIYIAGLETYSEVKEMTKLCLEAVNCKSRMLPSSKHEVLMDKDENRSIVIDDIKDFFS